MAVGPLSGARSNTDRACLGRLGAMTGTGRPSLSHASAGSHARPPPASCASLSLPTGARLGAQTPPQHAVSTRCPAGSSRHLLTEQRAGLSFPGSPATCRALSESSQHHRHPQPERHGPQQPSPFLPRPLHSCLLNPHPSAEAREHITSSRKAFGASLPGVVGSLRQHTRSVVGAHTLHFWGEVRAMRVSFRGGHLYKHTAAPSRKRLKVCDPHVPLSSSEPLANRKYLTGA